MKALSYITLVASLLMLTSCTDDLDEVVWKDDPNDVGLPVYSEWGYNTFGAYINERVFAANHTGIGYDLMNRKSLALYSTEETLGIKLSTMWYPGMDGDRNIHHEDRDVKEVYHIKFTIPYKGAYSCTDLADLNDTTFDLTDENCEVELSFGQVTGGDTTVLKAESGLLDIKRVQILHVDGLVREAIISGTFEGDFTADIKGQKRAITIKKGRFDLGVKSKDLINKD